MLGPRKEKNPYTAELSAISQALRCLSNQIQGRNIYIITWGLSTVQGLMQPKQQSGQTDIRAVYQSCRKASAPREPNTDPLAANKSNVTTIVSQLPIRHNEVIG